MQKSVKNKIKIIHKPVTAVNIWEYSLAAFLSNIYIIYNILYYIYISVYVYKIHIQIYVCYIICIYVHICILNAYNIHI